MVELAHSSWFLGVYWGARKEDPASCARRFARTIDRLKRVDAGLGRWAAVGRNRRPIAMDVESLAALLHGGVNPTDFGGEVISDIGFRAVLVSEAEPAVGLSVKCGGWSPWLPNTFILDLLPGHLLEPAIARALLEAAVEEWEADSGLVATASLLDVTQPREVGRARIGWLSYLRGLDASTELPGATVEPLADGALITLAPTAEEVDRKRVESVAWALDEAGLLHSSG